MLSWLTKRVAGKIAAGYALLALLMPALTLIGLRGIEQVNREVRTITERLMQTLTLAREMATETVLIKADADAYFRAGRQDDLNRFIERLQALTRHLGDFRRQVKDPGEMVRLLEIDRTLTDYKDAFETGIDLIRRRRELVETRLRADRYTVEERLNALRTAFSRDRQMHRFLLYDNAQDAFAKMELHATEYLQWQDEKFAVLFARRHREALAALDELSGVVNGRGEADTVLAARRGLEDYALVFEALHSGAQRLAQLQGRVLRGLETAVIDGVARLGADLEEELRDHQARSEQRLHAARRNLLAFAALVLVLGLSAGVLVARRITQPLTQVMVTSKQIADRDLRCLIGQLDRLALGDLNVDFRVGAVPLEIVLSDELGEMARAFNAIVEQLQAAREAFAAMTGYLKRIAEVAEQVKEGRLEVEMEPAGPADTLGHGVQNMLAALRRTEAEVRAQREFLEQQVLQRTAELEENRRSLAVLLSNLQGMAYRCRNDADWTTLFVSSGALALTGYPAEALIENREVAYGSLIHPDDRQAVWNAVQQALAERTAFVLLYRIRTREGEEKWVWEKGLGIYDESGQVFAVEGFVTDISDRKRLEQERERLIEQLQKALAEVKTLSGLLPICSSCKRIRDDQGYWQQIESYLHDHSNVDFSHGICPECMRRLYPDFVE